MSVRAQAPSQVVHDARVSAFLGAAVATESSGEADSEPYSQDLRERVVRAVAVGASSHKAIVAFVAIGGALAADELDRTVMDLMFARRSLRRSART
jgi:hypothetical protein